MELAETTAAGRESREQIEMAVDRDRYQRARRGRVLSGNVIAVGPMFAAMGSALIAFLALHK
jgi:hypothetical protein